MAFEVRDWWLAELGMFLSRSALFLLSSLGRGGVGVMCGWIRADHVGQTVLRYLVRKNQNFPHFPLSCSPCPGGRMADRARGDVAVIESNSRRAQGGKVKVTNPLFPPTAFSPHFIPALFLPLRFCVPVSASAAAA